MEAKQIAATVRQLIDSGLPILDRASNQLRAIRPGDIAILARTWEPLKLYGDALAAREIAAVHLGGGSLFDTREAKDGWALLRFLTNQDDNLALAAVLRSPFCAVSDRELFQFVQPLANRSLWWGQLSATELPELSAAYRLLTELVAASRYQLPGRLLQLADQITGYRAVIANLAGGARREADWRGFCELVQQLEQQNPDLITIVRRLRRIIAANVEVPRPSLESGDAVSLMTIHAAKGLEWPVVVLPDLARLNLSGSATVYFDAELGAAFKIQNATGDLDKPLLYTLLEQRQQAREEAEGRRILYVALTRARDRLLLTATDQGGGMLEFLLPGLAVQSLTPELVEFDPAQALPVAPPEPELPPLPTNLVLT